MEQAESSLDFQRVCTAEKWFVRLGMAVCGIACWFRAKVSAGHGTHLNRSQFVTDPKYAAFTALDPFFEISRQGLAGLVDGDHYFDTIADDAVFEFRYIFPGWPETLNGRQALIALYAGYGKNIVLHAADALVIHRSQDPRVVIIEYEVHGKIVATGASYDNRFISVITIENRKIRHWRDYMDSLGAWTALNSTS